MAASVEIDHSQNPVSVRSRLYYTQHRNDPEFLARIAAKSRRWRENNPAKARAIALDYKHRHLEQVRSTQRQWHAEHRERSRELSRSVRQRLRADVLAAYGGVCACCGEVEFAFLMLDHVNGGGTRERRQLGPMGPYRRARQLKYPAEYRILCANCNHARAFGGSCPHGGR